MNQIQCPNCKSFKVGTQAGLSLIFGFCAGSCLMIIPPIGVIVMLAGIIGAIYLKVTGRKRYICLDCRNQFTL